ncbi:MAG: hypothetical protein QF470_00395 [Methylococcales bacterium]|jgi:uncharacterized protein YukE|nr:hypothetical protein [Methylococcales bacterium]
MKQDKNKSDNSCEQLINALDELGDNLKKINNSSVVTEDKNNVIKRLADTQQLNQTADVEKDFLTKIKRTFGINSKKR